MKPIEIRLQNAYSNTGIQEYPMVCWKYGNGTGRRIQKACVIQIWDADKIVFDSGIMETEKQTGHCCACVLESHKQYQVIVKVLDDGGIWETGEVSWFVSGVTDKKCWNGTWISNGSGKPHYLGRNFSLGKNIAFAAISVAGVGQYRMTINGQQPDESVLNGSWTNFDKNIHYQTYDVTSLLSKENEILIEVGNGWYMADLEDTRHFYTRNAGYRPFGDCLAAIARLTVRFKDGSEFVLGTDKEWWSMDSETTFTNIYGSEDYDARLECAADKKQCLVLTEDRCPKGELIPMLYPPVKIKRSYPGSFSKELEDGSLLYDLGQNMSGLFELEVIGQKGTKVRILPVEKVDVLGNPWKSTESWCCYTLKGQGREIWKPKFTYGAGRYIVISVDPESNVKEMPEICSVTGYFITNSAKDTGRFFCSDYRYMEIHDLVLRAVESNLNHVHTDCPTVEKLGWQEPNHLMGPSVFYTKEVATLWEKISMDQRDSQYQDGEYDVDDGEFPHQYGPGLLPSIAPAYARFTHDYGVGSFWDIIPWGSSLLLGAYEMYRFTGNKDLLKTNYEAAKKYVAYLYEKYLNYGQLYNKPAELHFLRHGLGDWGIVQGAGDARENLETAYLYRDMKVMEEVAQWLGREDDQKYYKQISEEILQEYNRELLVWNPSTGEWAYRAYDKDAISPTQATQALPLQFGMVPEDKKESVIRSFLYTCEDETLHTGEIGLPYILRTLGDLGQSDLVQKMIFQKVHPSYYRFIEKGETTLPEFWRDDARSRNHDMMGSILEWMYRYMAGISSEDGYQNITIAPKMPEGVNHIRCSYESILGTVEVAVWKEPVLHMEVQLPPNTKGRVWLDDKWFDIPGGCVHRLRER